jgi:hypothetical protein
LNVKPRAVARSPRDNRVQFLGALLVLVSAALAAPPELKHLYPAGGQQGTNVAVTIGKTDTWPNIWIDSPAIKFTPTPILGTYNVEISADAPVGPHLVRAWNAEGASAPRFFIVSHEPELLSSEPNDSPTSPQLVTSLPATLSGRLDKSGDVDSYSVRLRKGETLVSWVEAYVLASTFDGLLRITDSQGRVLAFNHDYRTLDPLLAWTAPDDGTFLVQGMGCAHPPHSSVPLTGGEGCVYRLHLTSDPLVRFTIPAMVQAGTRTTLRLIGWNIPTSNLECDASQLLAGSTWSPSHGPVFLEPLHITEFPESVETEQEAEPPQVLSVPSAVTGRISSARQEDRYTFNVVKGQAYEVKVTAAAFGSPLDAWLRIENPEHKEVAKNDDAKGRDPQITWTPSMGGPFTVTIGSVTHRGGDDYLYRLGITEPSPNAVASVASHSAAVTAGKSADLKVTIKRTNGFKSRLQLTAKNLPNGISAPPVEVPEKDGEVTVKLTAEPTAIPAGQPFSLALKEIEGIKEYPVRYALAATSEDNGVPQGFADLVIDSTEELWLTVLPAPGQ